MVLTIPVGATDQSVLLKFLTASTGVPVSVNHDEAGLALKYLRGGYGIAFPSAVGSTAAALLASLDAAHTDGGVEPTTSAGESRCDFADAAFAAGVPYVKLWAEATDTAKVCIPIYVRLDPLLIDVGVLQDGDLTTSARLRSGASMSKIITGQSVLVVVDTSNGERYVKRITGKASPEAESVTFASDFPAAPGDGAPYEVWATEKLEALAAADFADGFLTAAKIASDAITAAKIGADALALAKFAADLKARLLATTSVVVHDSLSTENILVTAGAGPHSTAGFADSDLTGTYAVNILAGRHATFMTGALRGLRVVIVSHDAAAGDGTIAMETLAGAALPSVPAAGVLLRIH
jgi:hypothetical protein